MKKLENILKIIKRDTPKYKTGQRYIFGDFINPNFGLQKGNFDYPGVYLIYEKRAGLIYVGSAGKGKHFLRFRLADLFFYEPKYGKMAFKHSLSRKLLTIIKRFKTIKSLREFYLKKCFFKVIKTSTVREARIVESILIELLNPKYNSE